VKLDVEPWLETYRPVYAHMRDGPQIGDWQ